MPHIGRKRTVGPAAGDRELRARVDSVSATTPDDIVLQLTGGASVVWGSAERSALKTLTLQRLMAASPDSTTFDVSSPGVGVVG